MNKSYKTVSVWYNSYGVDEMYFEKKNTKFDSKFLKEASESVSWLDNVPRSEFEIEGEGEGWVMFGYDGIGILCSDIGTKEANALYEAWYEEEWSL